MHRRGDPNHDEGNGGICLYKSRARVALDANYEQLSLKKDVELMKFALDTMRGEGSAGT